MQSTDAPTSIFRLLALLTVPVMRHAFRLDSAGREHLPQGGFVLCANHLSGFDPWALSEPLYPRQPRFMTKAEAFRPPFRALLSAIGVFPVRRNTACVEAIRTAVGHAQAGRVVIVFPEGSRRRKEKQPDSPRGGAALIALLAGVPLVPAAVAGTNRIGEPWRVLFGPAIALDDLDTRPRAAAARQATERLWQQVMLLEELVA
jgi:1-acyl-sn-glycerol-3-phosphate acyltransferase